MRTETNPELTLIRTIAATSRPLDKDLNLSQLQAIDRLHKTSERFKDQWIYPSPWLVLEDCYTLPARMPVPKMLEAMEKHGKPIGMVGMAWLTLSKRYAVLRMMFRKDAKSRKTIEESAQTAERILSDAIRQVSLQMGEEK